MLVIRNLKPVKNEQTRNLLEGVYKPTSRLPRRANVRGA